MSAILAVFSTDGSGTDDALVARMLARMGARGGARAGVWREGGAVIAISRHQWEFGAGFSGPVLVIQDGDLIVAADASLYYKDDLRRKLADKRVRPKGQTPSHLIVAAYHAFGWKCAEVLEGDFSFVLWDRKARRVVASRDFMGRRPLFFAEFGSTLVISSAIGAILEHPLCSTRLNLPVIAETMAGYVTSDESTCYKSISRLHAGSTLLREGRARIHTVAHWHCPTFHSGNVSSFDDAADELRERLSAAVAERMSHTGRTAVWMSGGRDSTAVFAAGCDRMRTESMSSELVPVSISYPPGDSGREDEAIASVAAHWNAEVRWVDVRDIPLVDQSIEHAGGRDEPLAHVFQGAWRALAAATSSLGAHVALDGVGGDQLFLRSSIQFADLFRTGNWLELARGWKAAGFSDTGFATFFQWAIQPALPTSMLLGARHLRRGRPLRAWLRRRLPQWIDSEFARKGQLVEYERVLTPRRRGEAIGSTESRWYFTDPFFPSVFSLGAGCALEHGVEIRSPLYDRRIIEFAATRPASDHQPGVEGKRLLRHAMRNLLPHDVVLPRDHRTGTPEDYTADALRQVLTSRFDEQFPASALKDLGLINIAAFERARTRFLRDGSPELRLPLLLTLHTELWLRAQRSGLRSPLRFRSIAAQARAIDMGVTSEPSIPVSPEGSIPLFV